jgi:hypothetical protein
MTVIAAKNKPNPRELLLLGILRNKLIRQEDRMKRIVIALKSNHCGCADYPRDEVPKAKANPGKQHS